MADSIAAIQARIAATFDHTQTNPLQAILDEEGPEALIDAVLVACNETSEEAPVGSHGSDAERRRRDRADPVDAARPGLDVMGNTGDVLAALHAHGAGGERVGRVTSARAAETIEALRNIALHRMRGDSVIDHRAAGGPVTWGVGGSVVTPAELDALDDLHRAMGWVDEEATT